MWKCINFYQTPIRPPELLIGGENQQYYPLIFLFYKVNTWAVIILSSFQSKYQYIFIQTCCNCFHLGSSSRLVESCNYILDYFGWLKMKLKPQDICPYSHSHTSLHWQAAHAELLDTCLSGVPVINHLHHWAQDFSAKFPINLTAIYSWCLWWQDSDLVWQNPNFFGQFLGILFYSPEVLDKELTSGLFLEHSTLDQALRIKNPSIGIFTNAQSSYCMLQWRFFITDKTHLCCFSSDKRRAAYTSGTPLEV